jgi:hypothetical protein
MKHPPNLNAIVFRSIKDQAIAESVHFPRPQAQMPELGPWSPDRGIRSKEFKGIISGFQKAPCQQLIFGTKPTKDGLQIAENILAFLEVLSHQPAAMMRSMLDRSPTLNLLFAASFSRSWIRGGASASSAIHLSNACLATSSLSRYPWAIWRWMKASIGPVIVISILPRLVYPLHSVNAAPPSR